MKRRHRRVLFNLFAFSLLAIAVYLNMYRMNDGGLLSLNSSTGIKTIAKHMEKPVTLLKITSK